MATKNAVKFNRAAAIVRILRGRKFAIISPAALFSSHNKSCEDRAIGAEAAFIAYFEAEHSKSFNRAAFQRACR